MFEEHEDELALRGLVLETEGLTDFFSSAFFANGGSASMGASGCGGSGRGCCSANGGSASLAATGATSCSGDFSCHPLMLFVSLSWLWVLLRLCSQVLGQPKEFRMPFLWIWHWLLLSLFLFPWPWPWLLLCQQACHPPSPSHCWHPLHLQCHASMQVDHDVGRPVSAINGQVRWGHDGGT